MLQCPGCVLSAGLYRLPESLPLLSAATVTHRSGSASQSLLVPVLAYLLWRGQHRIRRWSFRVVLRGLSISAAGGRAGEEPLLPCGGSV